MTIRPSYSSWGMFVWVKDKLVDANYDGTTPSDLYKELKANYKTLDFKRYCGNGVYGSFLKQFWNLILLKWVVRTGKKEPAYQKYDDFELKANRTYFRISARGKQAGDAKWSDPQEVLHPRKSYEERKEYYGEYRRRRLEERIAKGLVRRRGRPRFAEKPPVKEKPPKKERKPREVKPKVPPISGEFEKEIKALAPTIDKMARQPGLATDIEATLTDIKSRAVGNLKKVKGAEKERLEGIVANLSGALSHLPLVRTALALPPGTRREAVLVSSVEVIKEDLGL